MKRLPIHILLLACYPILALLANNIIEVDPRVAIRSFAFVLGGTLLLFLIFLLPTRDWLRAGLLTSLMLILFFSYGHLYEFLEQRIIFGLSLGRHRFLVPLYGVLLLVSLWWIIKRIRDVEGATQVLNIAALVLIIFPVIQIGTYSIQVASGRQAATAFASGTDRLSIQKNAELPDIYYIILDAYTRADALKNDLNFDNSPFLNELETLGFYVAQCSRSNYAHTMPSIASALNLKYRHMLAEDLESDEIGISELTAVLKNSVVRRQLEALGYKTVAFDTGYEATNFSDAEIYLAFTKDPFLIQAIEPFEALLIRSTAGLIYTDWIYKSQIERVELVDESLNSVNFPFQTHIERQKYILEQLPKIPSISGPKFVFVHLVVTHFPYLFTPTGEIQTDPGFFAGKLGRAINEEYEHKGYLDTIQFLNPRLLEIVRTIIQSSDTPPIIIIQGDHGLKLGNRNQIINAYYLPGMNPSPLHPSITPVNSFRIVFDSYFDTDYGILPDKSYEEATLIPETSPDCIQQVPATITGPND